jgi:hypothetical protein
MGDYLYISTNPSHGLVVVGWGEALNCGQAIFANGTSLANGYRQWSINNFGLTYADAQAKIISNPVLYVADYTTAQSPMPRPFYCTWYDQTSDPTANPPPGQSNVLRFNEHWFHFYQMPDEVRLLAQQLYTNTNWVWGVPQ